MDDLDILLILIVGLGCLVFGFFIGIIMGAPNELDNGCVVTNNKLYCEVNND